MDGGDRWYDSGDERVRVTLLQCKTGKVAYRPSTGASEISMDSAV